MTSNTFFIGDLHIGHNWCGLDRTEESFTVLDYCIEAINKAAESSEKVRAIFLGDIFDSPSVSHHLITRFIKCLNSFSRNVAVDILCGNHDGIVGSKRGSPLQEVAEAVPSDNVVFSPVVFDRCLLLPYCEQEVLNDYCSKVNKNDYDFVCCHCDLPSVDYSGNDTKIGLTCLLPESVITGKPIFAGHIHKPQLMSGNILVVGSSIQTSITEQVATNAMVCWDNSLVTHNVLPCKKIRNFDINYGTDAGKDLLAKLYTPESLVIDKMSIVSLRLVSPHNLAHEIDIPKLQSILNSHAYFTRISLDIVKEKAFRMKELDSKLSDLEIASKFLDNQDISEKELILTEVKGCIGES